MGEGGLHSKHTIVILTVGIDNNVTQIAFAQHNHFPHLSQLHPFRKNIHHIISVTVTTSKMQNVTKIK